jgi:hypothetical protein
MAMTGKAMDAFKPIAISSDRFPDRALRWSARALVAIVWVSSAIFGLYILALYIGAVAVGSYADWNDGFPGIYTPRSFAANIGIGLHFAFGAILLLLGPIQLMAVIRARWPAFHRWTGRVYASAAIITGLGGLTYIAMRGTIGGPVMSIGFAMYGALMAITAVQTVRFAMARRLERHRAWAVRLFALAIGSWLYRMDYGFWRLLTHSLGHTKDFRGWFDIIMVFWFYIPNLAVAEIFIRGRERRAGPATKVAAAAAMSVAFLVLLLATTMVALLGWGPAILWRFGLIDG